MPAVKKNLLTRGVRGRDRNRTPFGNRFEFVAVRGMLERGLRVTLPVLLPPVTLAAPLPSIASASEVRTEATYLRTEHIHGVRVSMPHVD